MLKKENSGENYLREIEILRTTIRKLVFLSVPGMLWHLEKWANIVVEKITEVDTSFIQIVRENSLLLGVSLALFVLPFEIAEHKMTDMKEKLRNYRSATGEKVSPIKYTRLEIVLNRIMKIAHDRSPLVPDESMVKNID